MQRVAVCCSVLQCFVVCCSVMQCLAVWCRVLQCVAACCSAMQRVAVCCSVLQCVAVWCSVLQSVAECFSVCAIFGFSSNLIVHVWHKSAFTKTSKKISKKKIQRNPSTSVVLPICSWSVKGILIGIHAQHPYLCAYICVLSYGTLLCAHTYVS